MKTIKKQAGCIMQSTFAISRRKIIRHHFLRAILFSLSLFIINTVCAAPLPDPTALGPYKVGYMQVKNIALPPTPFSTNLAIWYPTNISSGAITSYPTSRSITYQGQRVKVDFTLPSLLGARENVAVATGTFPLIIVDHGSGATNSDIGRFQEYELNEFYASHGFIVVGYTHYLNATSGVNSLVQQANAVLNYMVNNSLIRPSIIANKIGLLGFSQGGIMTYGLAAGTPDVAKNPNIAAMISLDGVYIQNAPSSGALSDITIPALQYSTNYLSSEGSQLLNQSNGNPVIKVYDKRANHNSLGIICNVSQVNRSIAVSQGVAEPLVNGQGNPNGELAWQLWNFAVPGEEPGNTPSGGGAEFCDVSTWLPAVSPSLILDRKTTPQLELRRRLRIYTLSFWQTYLAGVSGYASYLTPEYANKNFPSDELTVSVGK